jgi:hypothetical protein
MFMSLELGRDERELEQGGLSLRKNPLLVSIVDGCETLKALVEKQQLKPEDVAGAKALITLRTDKVAGQTAVRGACSAPAAATGQQVSLACPPPTPELAARLAPPADRLWHLGDAGLRLDRHAAAHLAERLVSAGKRLAAAAAVWLEACP